MTQSIETNDTRTFERLESNVRSYCRSFPTVFQTASGHTLVDERGRGYTDFFAGAGALNYGHNPAPLKEALLEYLTSDGVTHSLDLYTSAKRRFLDQLEQLLADEHGATVVRAQKPTFTRPAPAELADEVALTSDAVVEALAD